MSIFIIVRICSVKVQERVTGVVGGWGGGEVEKKTKNDLIIIGKWGLAVKVVE